MNKILGFSAVIIMIAAMGYIVVSYQHIASQAREEGQTTRKNKNTTTQNTTAPKTKSSKKNSAIPNAQPTDWNLILVGPEHRLEQEVDESTQLVSLPNGYLIDKRIQRDYEDLAKAAQNSGFPLVMVSAYRSVSSQQEVFAQNVQEVMSSQNVSEEEATAITKQTITEPGYSEHHTGLAVDVVDENWYNNYPSQLLDASYGGQPGAKWIAENASKYGFIVRYPKDRQAVTKITYEPWHLRYVGKENAEYITQHNITLEEYLDQLKKK
ncbi:MAG: M15 family metallopeptidase [Enterococcus lacertideformus]|uniref:M15 family metallopeptidase n=1 Tax=Enterococcus lacertideformus TaxID=2771493 RepID=A0A931FBR4_9ENTE|nr:M15 family metallopeptidase [Enterococcus lacertideformus]